MSTRSNCLLFVAVSFLVFCLPTYALNLAQTRVVLKGADAVGQVEVYLPQDAGQPEYYEVELFSWSQHNGQAILKPENDVVVFPRQFMLQPGDRTAVRVGLPAYFSRSFEREQTYRLLLRRTDPVNGVRPSYSLPIFVRPQVAISPRLTVEAEVQDGVKYITVRNVGSMHHYINEARISSESVGADPWSMDLGYILSGAFLTKALPEAYSAVDGLCASVELLTSNEIISHDVCW